MYCRSTAVLHLAREPRCKEAATKYSRLIRQQYGVSMEREPLLVRSRDGTCGSYMRCAGQKCHSVDTSLFIISVLPLSGGVLSLRGGFFAIFKGVSHKKDTFERMNMCIYIARYKDPLC